MTVPIGFYVYQHIRLDTNEVFYVGKGSGKRAQSKRRNIYWRNIVKKYGYRIEIIKENLTEQEAFQLEIEWITLMKDIGLAKANLSTGGEGPSGHRHSEKTKQRWSDLRKGNGNPLFGKIHSSETRKKMADTRYGKVATAETKKKMSKTHRGKVCSVETRNKMALAAGGTPFQVVDKNGVIVGEWISQNLCGHDLKLIAQNINACLKGKRKTHKGYTFHYIKEV